MSKLQNRDYVLVLDKSGSMEANDCPGGQTRWRSAEESTVAISRKISAYDPDGITVIPFASNYKVYEGVTPDTVERVFKENSPMGGTTLGPVLEHVFADYKKRKAAGQTKANGEMLLVVTDGAPTDPEAVSRAIVSFANTLENGDDEYGISFFQVGKDSQATAFLKKLDDDLVSQGAKWDIVDTKTMDELENMTIEEALIAALDD